MTLRLYDNTKISTFRGCKRFYYYRHERDWVTDNTAPALAFGSAWHSAMDVAWTIASERPALSLDSIVALSYEAFVARWTEEGMLHPDEIGPDEAAQLLPRTPMVAMEMLYEYTEERLRLFRHPTFRLIAVEQPFAVPLDPGDPSLFYVGRFDKVYEHEGDVLIGEHKTTSLYRKNGPFMNSFTESFSPNSQIDGYLYAGHMLYGKRMRRLMIDAALVHRDVHDGFRFLPIERQFAQLEAWLWETRSWIAEIEANRSALQYQQSERYLHKVEPNYMAAYAKNTSACTNFGTCQYIDLCKMWSNPMDKDLPDGFKESHWSPFDELKLEKLGFKKEDVVE